jgi:hypothetical protein
MARNRKRSPEVEAPPPWVTTGLGRGGVPVDGHSVGLRDAAGPQPVECSARILYAILTREVAGLPV